MTEKPRKPHDPTDMTHPLYDPDRDPLSPFYKRDEADSDGKGESDQPAADDYKVGPGFPPREYTWRKGCPTPNPMGRPRKEPSLRPDMKKAFEDAIFEKVEVKFGDKKTFMMKMVVGLRHLATQFAKGDRHARRDVFHYATVLGVELHAKEIIDEVLGVSEQAIVDAAFRRHAHQAAPEVSSDDHVKAPPDLLDDDAVKTDTNETPHAAPQQAAKQLTEPAFHKKSKPPSEAETRYANEQRAHFVAEQKKKQGGS